MSCDVTNWFKKPCFYLNIIYKQLRGNAELRLAVVHKENELTRNV